jgi:hypothetical protein
VKLDGSNSVICAECERRVLATTCVRAAGDPLVCLPCIRRAVNAVKGRHPSVWGRRED